MDQNNSCYCNQNQDHPSCCLIGPMGPKGATGPAGTASGEKMLLFASGGYAVMTTVQGGLSGIPSFVGFGACGQGLSPFTSPINVKICWEILSPVFLRFLSQLSSIA